MHVSIIIFLVTLISVVLSSSIPFTPVPFCFRGGCAGEICSDRPGMASTCEWKEEYGCYQTAICKSQDNGKCGWLMTEELENCLNQYN